MGHTGQRQKRSVAGDPSGELWKLLLGGGSNLLLAKFVLQCRNDTGPEHQALRSTNLVVALCKAKSACNRLRGIRDAIDDTVSPSVMLGGGSIAEVTWTFS